MSGETPPTQWDLNAFNVGKRLAHLKGVRVLDVTRALAGPYAGMLLGDLGAEVIKIEPLEGDPTRGNPPYEFGGDGGYFLAANRNKVSIAINLRTDQGREIISRLVRTSDIVLDNLRTRQRTALGLDYASLAAVNPRIVSCSLTGFGSQGPYAARPAYDIVVEALAGVMSLTGPLGGPSVRAGVPIGDIVAGLYSVIGVLSGLQHREAHGKGTHIDISMLDCQVSLLSYLAQYYLLSGDVAEHQGSGHVGNPMYDSFSTSDGKEIVMNAGNDDKFRAVCEVLGRPELVADPRFATRKERLAHRQELQAIMREEMGKRAERELYEAYLAAGVPSAPINSIDRALADPQVRYRDMVVRIPHHSGAPFLGLGSPVKSEDAEGDPFTSPPAKGTATTKLLAEVGYTTREIDELRRAGVVATA
jgi:CoA:oxalate CoA-transferase